MNLVKSPAKLPQFYTPGITPPPDRRQTTLARPVALIRTADGRVRVNSEANSSTTTTVHTSGLCPILNYIAFIRGVRNLMKMLDFF